MPTARVALDGQHVYASWFDLPSLEDQEAGRVYASFALDIGTPGEHTFLIAFDDFPRHTRWRPGGRVRDKPEVTHIVNPLRPHHIGSIAVGADERVRSVQSVRLRPELVGKHPRLSGKVEPEDVEKPLGPDDKRVQDLILFLDPDHAAPWEYSDAAESMASPPAGARSRVSAPDTAGQRSLRSRGARPVEPLGAVLHHVISFGMAIDHPRPGRCHGSGTDATSRIPDEHSGSTPSAGRASGRGAARPGEIDPRTSGVPHAGVAS